MLSGVHELLHLIECTLDYGPLNNINCFQFEEINRKMLRFIHGLDLIGEEMIKIFSTAQYLSLKSINIENYDLKEFVTSRLKLKSSNNKNKRNEMFLDIHFKCQESSSNTININLISKFTEQQLDNLSISWKLSIDGIPFSSHLNQTKRCDSCIYYENNKFGLIECFVKHEDRILVIIKVIVCVLSPYYSNLCPETRCKLSICYITNQLKVVDIRNVKKAALIKFSETDIYVSDFSVSHLFN